MKKYNNEIFGAICLLAAGFFLSFGGLLIRLVDDATTMQVTSYRSITFCLVALIYILIKFKSETPKAFINIGKDGLLLAVILGLSNIFFVFGMSNTSVANAVFLMSTGPLWAALASYFFLKKIVGLTIFQTSVFLLYITFGKIKGGTPPILNESIDSIYSNPLPHVLILTAIVVGVATTALGLSLVLRINKEYGSIEEDDISAQDLVDYHDDIETRKSVDLKFKQ